MGRNYLAALSFANFVYLRAWADLLPVVSGDAFYRKTLAGYKLYFAVAGDVLALSILTYLVINLAPKLPGWVQRVLPLIAIAMVALTIRSISTGAFARSGLFTSSLALVSIVAVIGMALVFSAQTVRFLRGAALAATPCLAVTLVGSLYYLSTQKPLPKDPPLAARLAGSPPLRVLWILFDDWDERLTFPDRAPGTTLPTLDGLAARSFTATNALAVQAGQMPVAQMSTYGAVPSLLYGRFAVPADVEDAASMYVEFTPSDNDPFETHAATMLGEGNTIFARVRARGWNSAVAGWYLPYCRIFGSQLTQCYWDQRYIQAYTASTDFAHAAVDETRMLFETTVFSPFGPSLLNARHVSEYQALLAAALRYAADPSIGFALIHFNIPHRPYFYDPGIGPSFRYGNDDSLYPDALRRVDRTVAAILASVKGAGLDGRTAIILSSDHPFRFSRSPDPHVPFIVHIPGGGGLVWTDEFSAIRSADLALAIADGQVKTSSDVAAFVTKKRL